MGPGPRYAVVLDRQAVDEARAPAVVDALVRDAGWLRADAAQALRRMRGILLPSTDRETAERVARAVAGSGLRAGVAPLEAADRFERRWPVRRGGCSKRGIHAELGGRGVQVIAWTAVHAVAVARHLEMRTVPVAGPPISTIVLTAVAGVRASLIVRAADARRDMLARSKRIEGEETYFADVFVREPGLTLRFDARRFHYGYLGKRMAERCEANFHMLVTHLAHGARHAAFSPLARRFLGGDALENERETDLKRIDLSNRWFLLATAAFESA